RVHSPPTTPFPAPNPHPAAANMFPRLPAVVQDIGLVAASVFEGVGEDGKAVVSFLVENRLGEGDYITRQPGSIDEMAWTTGASRGIYGAKRVNALDSPRVRPIGY